MKFFYTNLSDAIASSGVVATSAQTNLPVTNVQNERIDKVWRTGTSVAAENVVFDFGSATACTAAVIAGHTILSTDSTITLRASTDNFSASNVLAGTFTWTAAAMLLTFGSASYRYWKFSFTKASAGVTRDIGRLFLGTYTATTDDPDYDGFEESFEENSIKQKSRGGQTFVDIRPQFRMLKVKFTDITHADSEILKTYSQTVGENTSHFIQVQTSSPLDGCYYVKLTKAVGRKVAGFDTNFFWDMKALEYEEQL